MQKLSISVTRGLAELKSLDAQLASIGSEGKWVAVQVGQGTNGKESTGLTVEAASAKIQSSYNRLEQLLKSRQSLKAAIVLSNAKTMVTVNSISMSVAEAIELKSQVSTKEVLVQHLKAAYSRAQQAINQTNAAVDTQIQGLPTTAFGGDLKAVDAKLIDATSAPLKAQKEASLIDPGKILETIEKMEKEITTINVELDFVLSESNAVTKVEYDV